MHELCTPEACAHLQQDEEQQLALSCIFQTGYHIFKLAQLTTRLLQHHMVDDNNGGVVVGQEQTEEQ